MPDQPDIERITAALLQLHKANSIERMTYLCISAASFVVLVVCAVIALVASWKSRHFSRCSRQQGSSVFASPECLPCGKTASNC